MTVGCWLTYTAVLVVLHFCWPSSLAAAIFMVSTCERDEEVNFLCATSQELQIHRFVWTRTPHDAAKPHRQPVTDECLNETASTLEAQWNCNGRASCTLPRNESTSGDVCSNTRSCLFAQYSCLKSNQLSGNSDATNQPIKCPWCPIMKPCKPPPTPAGGDHLFGPHENVRATEIALIIVICILAVGHVITAVFLVRWLIAKWKRGRPPGDEYSRGELTLDRATTARRLSMASGSPIPPAPPPPMQHFPEPLHFKRSKTKAKTEQQRPNLEHRYSLIIPLRDQSGPRPY